ncbi:AMP-dependent synthetase/ligase [Sphingomonas solaris]|uniref:Long-chain fatty acid--CoA ligase n=1 Tax=Alterirhizorhabdus solaris TaxID=2529389 RepID=A0A558RCX2_9SPHN|nr:long-chain fatty acid--CoA ligase [Sphingomonas solaris]TVV77208.1 long-chain fatty acid--CoA ligase [Sphingomonas solaris]
MRRLERFPNLVAMFAARVATLGDAPFLWAKHEGAWRSTSWAQAGAQVSAMAKALRAIGLMPGDRVMLVSENRPEWCIADLAIMAAGCVTVPTYITNTERDHAHILENSGARAVIVSTPKLARTLMPAVMRSSACGIVIGIEPLRIGQSGAAHVHDWQGLIDAHPGEMAACAAAAGFAREDLACIIYTSGTGGAPRGVCQHHGAILHNVAGASAVIAEDFGWGDEVFLSFLPASHAYEHTGGQFLPIGLGAQIYYSEGLEKLASNIEEVRPTIMVVVPRLFEVLRARVLKAIGKQGRVPQYLLRRALAIGAAAEAHGGMRLRDRPLDLILSRTLRPQVGAKFGGRLKAMVAGGAPLNPEVGLFFHSLGITLLQGYGQTESAPIISCNRPKAGIRMDSVGPPIADTEVRIADDGEILVRGELVMHGYWRNPEETARVLQDGWLHTGDIGHLDAQGRVVITDRKKDLIVNDKGDNVAPQRIEGMLTLEPEILQAMVAGDSRPHLVGLIVPDPEWARAWGAAEGLDPATLHEEPKFQRALMAAVDRVNAHLSTTEKVRRILIADAPFTIENEQLTPSMKIRRHVIRTAYVDRLDALYRGK